ncbi:acyltransferase [Escherichia fergusonii]|uniref:acyltransferase n=1 Tax=Escherichia fergusonii TaxID=564 RepID=UPI003F6DE36E
MIKLIAAYSFRIYCFINRWVTTKINKLKLKANSVELGDCVIINGALHIVNKGRIKIGNGVKINSSLHYNPISHHQCSFYTSENAMIEIGDKSGLSGCTLYSVQKIYIGKRVLIGAGVNIYDTDFHSLLVDERLNGDSNIKSSPVYISDDCFIGSNVTILKGVTIGAGSVVAACSVVTKNIGENELWAGNPARYIRDTIYGE